MADSSVIRISQTPEPELKELDRSPMIRSPMRPMTPSRAAAPMSQTSAAIDKTMSTAANLVKFLPSGTVLAFHALSPSFTNKGLCYASNKYLTFALIHICALSCVFFSFTDTLIGRDGKIYYGLATPKGFYAFNYDGSDDERSKVLRDLGRFRIRLLDYIHAVFSVVVFLTIAFSNSDIQSCFFPRAGTNTKQLLVNLPLGAGFLSSLVFMIFPTLRKGIGYSDAAPHAQ